MYNYPGGGGGGRRERLKRGGEVRLRGGEETEGSEGTRITEKKA